MPVDAGRSQPDHVDRRPVVVRAVADLRCDEIVGQPRDVVWKPSQLG